MRWGLRIKCGSASSSYLSSLDDEKVNQDAYSPRPWSDGGTDLKKRCDTRCTSFCAVDARTCDHHRVTGVIPGAEVIETCNDRRWKRGRTPLGTKHAHRQFK